MVIVVSDVVIISIFIVIIVVIFIYLSVFGGLEIHVNTQHAQIAMWSLTVVIVHCSRRSLVSRKNETATRDGQNYSQAP